MNVFRIRNGIGIAVLAAITIAGLDLSRAGAADPVKLNWLDGQPPAAPQSVSWGVPWPKGKVQKSDSLVLKAADGKAIPVQTWPTGVLAGRLDHVERALHRRHPGHGRPAATRASARRPSRP